VDRKGLAMKFCVITGLVLGTAAIALVLDPKSIVCLLIVIFGVLIELGTRINDQRH
jgi:hypothetical protein